MQAFCFSACTNWDKGRFPNVTTSIVQFQNNYLASEIFLKVCQKFSLDDHLFDTLLFLNTQSSK